MVNRALLKAVKSEMKVLNKEKENQKEVDFIVDNWQFFAEDKGTIKRALFSCHPNNGTELLQELGLMQVVTHKIKQDVLVKSVLRMEGSPLFEQFLRDVSTYSEVTSFFILGKRALVMSNSQILKVPGKFIHKFESQGQLKDIYWQWAEDILGKVMFY